MFQYIEWFKFIINLNIDDSEKLIYIFDLIINKNVSVVFLRLKEIIVSYFINIWKDQIIIFKINIEYYNTY